MSKLKTFTIDEVFYITTPAKKFNANTVKFNGKYPYVARGESNNGIRGYITENEKGIFNFWLGQKFFRCKCS